MKRILSFLITIVLSLCLTGCGSIYSNYREVEQLLVIQTMGLDALSDGVRLTLAAPSTTGNTGSPVCLSGDGQSITSTIERIRNYSTEEDLFCSHVNHVVLGEDAARQGISQYLTYICRSPEMRIDTPLYVVREHSAEELISGVIGEGTGICEVLDAVKANADQRGDSYIFTAAQVVRELDRHNSALICALEYSVSDELVGDSGQGGVGNSSGGSNDGQKQEGEGSGQQESGKAQTGGENAQPSQSGSAAQESAPPDMQAEGDGSRGSESGQQPTPPGGQGQGKTASSAGYAIIKGDKLCGYIDRENAIGANFLLNLVAVSNIVVNDREGNYVTLEITQGGTEIVPVWDEDGQLKGIDIYADVSASVHEVEDSDHGQGHADYITGQLEAAVSERMRSVLQASKRLRADFLGLGDRVEMADAVRFRRLDTPFDELLPGLEIRISVSGKLSHTNNLKDA